MLTIEPYVWNGRDATRLANDLVELITLVDGGHLAAFRFLESTRCPSENVLWEAPWMTVGLNSNRDEELSQTGGVTGHALCLDYFGPPSQADAAAGLPIHGEAAARRWSVERNIDDKHATYQAKVQLPVAQLSFERTILLQNHESVVYIEEKVNNTRNMNHVFQWVQHATFAPPLLNSADSTFAVSGTRGTTSPLDYEGGSLLAMDKEFSWPYAPLRGAGGATVDLSRPFSAKGRGFVTAVQLDPRRTVEFVLAMNWKLRLGVGYCFRRKDFPWLAIWEENCARSGSPWNGTTQARGMEFGTTPLPLGREETIRRGDIFGTPTSCVVPAGGRKMACYLMFLFAIPEGIQSIENVEVRKSGIILCNERKEPFSTISGLGCEDFLVNG